MENKSRHYGDIKLWVERVINSCETMEQVITADKLIDNFYKKLQRNSIEKYWRQNHYEIISPLRIQLEEKRDQIFTLILKSKN